MADAPEFYRHCLRKGKYSTLAFAKKIGKKIHKEKGVHLYIYFCPFCQNYHLTKSRTHNGKLNTDIYE